MALAFPHLPLEFFRLPRPGAERPRMKSARSRFLTGEALSIDGAVGNRLGPA